MVEIGQAPVGVVDKLAGTVLDHLALLRSRAWAPALLILLVVVSFGLRLLWLTRPDGALIFDEKYYVNAARIILDLPVTQGDPYFGAQRGLDPNTEHPPGAKLIIAASMRLFGDNAYGWRFASVLFGTLSIPLVYGIARRLGGAAPVALLATFLYAFDNLVFVHSRIATLDIFLLTFLLLGIYCYLAGWPTAAGLALVAATLCKITGMYGVAVLLGFEALRLLRGRLETGRWEWLVLRPMLITTVVYAVSLPWLLGVVDSLWSPYKHPLEHVRHIVSYGFALTREGGPQGEESAPWQWLLNEVPMTYLRTSEQVTVNGQVSLTRSIIYFRGAMNPLVIFFALPALAYAAHAAVKRRSDLAIMALLLFAVTYLPYWPAAMVAHRISYLFYFLPTFPAVAMAAAQLMHAPQLPRAVRWAYIGAVLLAFYGYFPFRTIPE